MLVSTYVGINEVTPNALPAITVLPNPNNVIFTIKANEEGVYVIINELGQIIQTIKMKSINNYSVSLNPLKTGVYFILGESNSVRSKTVVTE